MPQIVSINETQKAQLYASFAIPDGATTAVAAGTQIQATIPSQVGAAGQSVYNVPSDMVLHLTDIGVPTTLTLDLVLSFYANNSIQPFQPDVNQYANSTAGRAHLSVPENNYAGAITFPPSSYFYVIGTTQAAYSGAAITEVVILDMIFEPLSKAIARVKSKQPIL